MKFFSFTRDSSRILSKKEGSRVELFDRMYLTWLVTHGHESCD